MSDNGAGLDIVAQLGALDLEAHFSALRKDVQSMRRSLDTFQYSEYLELSSVNGFSGVAGGPLVLNLGSPPPGFRWEVRAVQATGPTIAAIANVSADLYLARVGAGSVPGHKQASSGAAPSVGDWYTNFGAQVPASIILSGKQMIAQPGDCVVVVLTGTGVLTTTNFIAGAFVEQFAGFAGLVGRPQ